MSAVGTGSSHTWQSNITRETTIITYKHNTQKVYNNLYGSECYNQEKISSDCLMYTKSKGIK